MSISTDMNPELTFSTSTSRTEILNGNHEFKIIGYSLNKGLGIDSYIESATFGAGGYQWTIRFYPDGKNSYVSLFVALASDGTNIQANYDLKLVDQSGKNQHTLHQSGGLFQNRGSTNGFLYYMERGVLESSKYIKDDCLLIRVRVGVVVRTITRGEEANICSSVTVPSSNIGQLFGQILESGEGSDIRFKVGEKAFSAHKCVLAVHSPVFKAQFFGPMNYDTKECIEILDMEASVFKALLHFMYCDTLPDLEYLFAHHLLEAADRYGVERLRLMCEAKICEGITIATAATTLVLAEQHHCAQLKFACFQFLAQQQNLKAVMQTDSFSHLEQSCPSAVCELVRFIHK